MGTTFKMVELVGESEAGLEDAVKTAVKTSSRTVRGQSWIEVKEIRANLSDDGGIDRWQVKLDLAFRVEE